MEARGLGEHIANLLFEHDCVIIPGFGGFIANYKAAFIHPRSGDVYPPSKQISFNAALNRNDGLLVSYIAEKMALDYPAALQLVQKGVQEFNQELNSGRRMEIDRVGILYRDRDSRMRFIPNENNNFLRSSFGLPVLSIKPLLSGEPEVSSRTEIPVISYRRRLLRAAVIVLPIAMAGSFLLGSWMHKSEFEMAGFSLLRSQEVKALYSPQSEAPAALPQPDSAPSISALMDGSADNVLHINFETGVADPNGIAVRLKTDALPEAIPGSPEKENIRNNGKMWFVIAGAFSIESNANKLVEELKGQGFDASLAGKKGSLHLVSSGIYTSPEAARSALDAFKNDSRSGWILSR
jgi:nucleoid DNA-binding protein